MGAKGSVVAVCISEKSGTRKTPIPIGVLREDFGLEGDSHAGSGRQVSLLADESVEKMRNTQLTLRPGDFAENLTTSGITVHMLPVGTRLRIGSTAVLEVTQIGKKCHVDCEIMKLAGTCIMPREGIFARVVHGGEVKAGDEIEVEGE
ncbi:MAG: MOSC domain-containing protein [Armatimonadetes bacterium]|nr:MOSC domain-containing protein [Armatimonadota bacterium]